MSFILLRKGEKRKDNTQLTWICGKWFPSNYCSTLEIIFVHYNYDFENFFQELCFFITMYAI